MMSVAPTADEINAVRRLVSIGCTFTDTALLLGLSKGRVAGIWKRHCRVQADVGLRPDYANERMVPL